MLWCTHISLKQMINLDQKYESYVRNGSKKLRIDGLEERVRGYGYTDDGKDIDGYYLITDNYTLFYNREEQFLRMEALEEVSTVAWQSFSFPLLYRSSKVLSLSLDIWSGWWYDRDMTKLLHYDKVFSIPSWMDFWWENSTTPFWIIAWSVLTK